MLAPAWAGDSRKVLKLLLLVSMLLLCGCCFVAATSCWCCKNVWRIVAVLSTLLLPALVVVLLSKLHRMPKGLLEPAVAECISRQAL